MSLKISPLFADHAILQRSGTVPVWGTAKPGEPVRVFFDGTRVETRASEEGRWQVILNTLSSEEGPHELWVEASEVLHVRDILVGELWLCSGQSNMEFRLVKSDSAETEIPVSANQRLREFRVDNGMSPKPLEEVRGRWAIASPETAGNFSAVGYHFGKRLIAELQKPVGIINSSWGSTPVEAWSSAEALDRDPELKAARLRDDAHPVTPGVDQEQGPLGDPEDTRLPKQRATVLYHAMIHPLVPCAIRGILWYQGESNASRAVQYRKAFPLLIQDWRARWNCPELPFYFCQISAYTEPVSVPGESCWAELREAQTAALSLPGIGMVVLVDVGESEDIHPRNKRDVGERLAILALARTYGFPLRASGPLYRNFQTEGARIRLFFDYAEGGLRASQYPACYDVKTSENRRKPLVCPLPESPLQGFAICGEDRVWHWAYAEIEGDTLLVSAPRVSAPQAVRYGWADYPLGNLSNDSGLPASPFRTDDYEELTRGVVY